MYIIICSTDNELIIYSAIYWCPWIWKFREHRTIGITYSIQYTNETKCFLRATRNDLCPACGLLRKFRTKSFSFPWVFQRKSERFAKPNILFQPRSSPPKKFREHVLFHESWVKCFRFRFCFLDAVQFHQWQSNQSKCFVRMLKCFLCSSEHWPIIYFYNTVEWLNAIWDAIGSCTVSCMEGE
jgi:hypothetical protein